MVQAAVGAAVVQQECSHQHQQYAGWLAARVHRLLQAAPVRQPPGALTSGCVLTGVAKVESMATNAPCRGGVGAKQTVAAAAA